jgi:hypothetical protein
MENETVSIWKKKADELTVGESMKVGAVAMVITVVAPLAVLLAIGGGAHLYEKFKMRHAVKLEVVNNEE